MNNRKGMNWIFRLKWDNRLGMLVPVPEMSSGAAKGTSKIGAAFGAFLVATYSTGAMADPGLNELPTNGQIVSGSGQISQSGNNMTILQNTDRIITNWDTFNIGRDATVTFNQPSSSSVALNRVQTMGTSQIYGQLNANGQVFLINPSGVLFGESARIEVGGLVASTAAISNENFLTGNYRFENDSATGQIVNNGTISAKAVAFISPKITNKGSIETPDGTTALLAGEEVLLDFEGDQLINFTVERGTIDALIDNKGAILADQGMIVLTAKGIDEVSTSVVNHSGIIEAKGVSTEGGRILLLGDEVTVEEAAKIDASGATGGGEILVGGSWQNSDSSVHQATKTTIKKGAVLDASATESGDGGTIVAWSDITDSDSETFASGSFNVNGGPNGGNGGRIETSGRYLDVTGISVSAKAVQGQNGSWLLDPNDIEITNVSANLDSSGAPTYTSLDDATTIDVSVIEASLNGGTDVTIQTASNGANSEDGDIIVSASVTGSSGSLTLIADDDIKITENISLGTGDFTANATGYVDLSDTYSITANNISLTAGEFVDVSGDNNTGTLTATNTITINSAGDIDVDTVVAGGDMTFTGGDDFQTWGAITKTSGADATLRINVDDYILIDNTISSSSNALNVYLNSDRDDSSQGDITLDGATIDTNGGYFYAYGGSSGTGYAVGGGYKDVGVQIENSNISTDGGNIAIKGQGVNVDNGVYLYDNSVLDAAGGNIDINGIGDQHAGVYVLSTSAQGNEIKTSGAGTITIIGTSTSSTESSNADGVKFGAESSTSEGALIQSENGQISITGTGGFYNTDDGATVAGVNIHSTYIQSTGNGSIAIQGTANTTGLSDLDGVNIEDGSRIATGWTGTNASGTGSISITGVGAGSDGEGIDIDDSSTDRVLAGSGGVVIDGRTTAGTGYGVDISGDSTNTTIDAVGGTITIRNGSANEGSLDGGIEIDDAIIGSSSTTGITITGKTTNSGAGVNSDDSSFTVGTGHINMTGTSVNGDGLKMEDSDITVTTGNITLSGTGVDNDGLFLQADDRATTIQTASGNISLTGSTSNSRDDDDALFAQGKNQLLSILTTTSGDITFTGTSTSSENGTHAVALSDDLLIEAQGSGNIEITGTSTDSGMGVSVDNDGSQAAAIQTNNGNITITATGNSTGEDALKIDADSQDIIIQTQTSGNITLTGTSNTDSSDGIQLEADDGSLTIETDTDGDITITGTGGTDNGDGVYIESDDDVVTIRARTAGNISITGTSTENDGIEIYHDTASGTIISVTGTGTIAFDGSTTSTTVGDSGIEMEDVDITSDSGNITFTGQAGNTSVNGIDFTAGNVEVASVSGNITYIADTMAFDDTDANNDNNTSSNGVLTLKPYTTSTSISLGGTSGTLNFSDDNFGDEFVDGFSYIQIGETDNTGGITIEGVTSVADDLRLVQGNGTIAINAALTLSTTNDYLRLQTTGASIEGASGSITATNLELLGTGGSHTLTTATDTTGNNVSTIAADTGSVDYADQDALDINTVNSTTGITATGTISVVTKDDDDEDDLTVSQNVTTTDTSTSAIFMNAGESENAPQTTLASGRADIIHASGSFSTGTGGRVTLMTGSIAGSTAAATTVGSSSGNFRYGSDEATTNYDTTAAALGTGTYLIYREAPTITITPDAYTSAYGGSVSPTDYTLAGTYYNGDTSPGTMSNTTIVSTGTNTSNAGSYTLSFSGSPSSALGYNISKQTNVHTITPIALTITAENDRKTYDGVPYSNGNGITASGFVNGETVSDLGGSLSYGGTSQGATSPGTFSIEPGGYTSTNYTISYVNGSLIIDQVIDSSTITPPTTPLPPSTPDPVDPVIDPVVEIIPSSNDTSFDFGGLNLNTGLGDSIEFEPTTVQVVVYRSEVAPVAEKGFKVSEPGDQIKLESVDEIEQGFAAPGEEIDVLPFKIKTDTGGEIEFVAKVTKNGVLIDPKSEEGAELSEGRRDLVIGTALTNLKANLGINASAVRTVYIKLN